MNMFIDKSVIFKARPLKLMENKIIINTYNILKFHTKRLHIQSYAVLDFYILWQLVSTVSYLLRGG